MPEKDGDEGKSTKSVVNKKQKQMMGEEGYDIARDMGRVRPSKDKKDATTMPPSKEMEKTRKVNKGPSALERVKAKYGKSVMNMGKKKVKEELDLTQVAETFGGYIIEAKTEKEKPKQLTLKIADKSAGAAGRADSRNPKMGGGPSSVDLEKEPGDKRVLPDDPGQAGKAGKVRIVQKGVKKPKVTVVQTGVKSPKPEKPEDIKGTAKQFVKDLGTTGEKQTPQTKEKLKQTIERGKPKRGSVKMSSQRNVFTGKPELEKYKTTYNTRTKTKKPKMDKGPVIPGMEPYVKKLPSWARSKPLTPERQKAVDAVKKGIETRQIINPDRRSRKRVSASGTPFKIPSKPKSTPLFFTNRPKGVGDTGTGLRKSLKQFKIDADSFDKKLKDFSTKLKQTRTQIDQTKTKVKSIPEPEVQKIKPKNVKLVGGSKVTGDVEPDFVGPKAAPRSRNKVVQRIKVAARSTKRPVQRLVKPAGSALAKTAKFAGKNPFATLVGASMAKDTFFPAALPKPPTVQGGKVGRRTAG